MINPPVIRRETLFWLWTAALILLVAAVSSAVAWAMLPHPRRVDLGAISQLRADGPTLKLIALDSAGPVPIWLIRAGPGWLAFDGRSRPNPNCRYRWLPMDQQFWDVCSGLTLIWDSRGELLSYPSPSPADLSPFLRDLDRYPTTVENGQLLVDFYQRLPGAQRLSPPADAVCKEFFDLRINWLRCVIPT